MARGEQQQQQEQRQEQGTCGQRDEERTWTKAQTWIFQYTTKDSADSAHRVQVTHTHTDTHAEASVAYAGRQKAI